MIQSFTPAAKRSSNKRTVDVHEVVDGNLYVLSIGCQWAALPKNLPPRSTLSSYFLPWAPDRTLDRLHHALYVQYRKQNGREARPTVGIIYNQSATSAEKEALGLA